MEPSSTLQDDIIPATPEARKPKQRKKPIGRSNKDIKWKCDTEVMPSLEAQVFCKQKNLQGPLKSQVYIFHSFREVLKYNVEQKPINNYLKIIGQYKLSRSGTPYVQSYDPNERTLSIFVSSKLQLSPKNNEVIEIFGHLEFETVANSQPIIEIHFWRKLDDNISCYIDLLKIQKKFIPQSAFGIKMNSKQVQDDSLMLIIEDLASIELDDNFSIQVKR